MDCGFISKSCLGGKLCKIRCSQEGFPIYKEGDLKINMPGSGETPLCPFDCECCF